MWTRQPQQFLGRYISVCLRNLGIAVNRDFL